MQGGRVVGKPKFGVMLSSTYKELAEHRQEIQHAMLGQELFPIAMENDAALPDHDLIGASLSKVDDSDAYVGLISYRYGQAPEDIVRNPDRLSLTELEFRRAVERRIPICMFIMHGDHPVPRRAVGGESDVEKRKLEAFTSLAKKDRIYAEFESVGALKAKAVQSLVKLREAIELRATPTESPVGAVAAPLKAPNLPPGWEIIDRDVLAKIRANPPSLDVVVQFFDGVLPTWRLALARGVQARAIAERLANRLRAVHGGAAKPEVVLLTGAGGEGKSTALLHAAASLVEDERQAWTCLYRQAANADLPEDAMLKLPITAGHAWVVVIDDADNIGPSILAAVKQVAKRTDVHVLLAARDAEWQLKRLVPSMWEPAAYFRRELLAGLTESDARLIVRGWLEWGDEAMGLLKGRSEDQAITALLGHAREFATRREDGELLGALLVTRQGEDMRTHVRTLVEGLGRKPVIRNHSLLDIYAMVATMHAENQLYLSRVVLAFAIGCEVDELEDNALTPLRREAMLDSGNVYLLTRHRRIAEAACAVLRENNEKIDRWYPFLARAARSYYRAKRVTLPDIAEWSFGLAVHFVDRGERWWPIARSVAKAVYDAEPEHIHSLTALCSVLRRTGQAAEAMAVLKATGERFRNHRVVLFEWSTVAGAMGDPGLDAWLCGRSLADGSEPIDQVRCKLSLAGLGVAFRELFVATKEQVFATAFAASGQMGLRLPLLDQRTQSYLEQYASEGRRLNIPDLSSEEAVSAIRKAVIRGAQEVEPNSDSIFFERLLAEPDSYHYRTLLRLVDGTAPIDPHKQNHRVGRRE
jgi:Mrp family chromosome partitioning ATPase